MEQKMKKNIDTERKWCYYIKYGTILERFEVKIDIRKLDMLLAQRCMNARNLRNGTSPQTITRIRQGADVRPATAGRIAHALGVNVSEILSQEGERP